MISESPIKFICLKWGTKYGPEYVNRLFQSICKQYRNPCEFYCYTDDPTNLKPEIKIRDIAELRKVENSCFTMEKLFLFDGLDFEGPYCLLDIDILIQSDITSYFKEYNFIEPRFSICARPHTDIDYMKAAPIFRDFGTCYVNSSFVTWTGDQLKWMIDFYMNNKKIIDYKYKDLDTFLFHTVLKEMKFHPRNMIYSFNHEKTRLDSPIVMFNTSHGRGVELHEGPTWAKELWESYDSESESSRLLNEYVYEKQSS